MTMQTIEVSSIDANVQEIAEEDGVDGDRVGDEELRNVFDFKQFLDLAERVFKHGDAESFTILDRLRSKWEARFNVKDDHGPPDLGTGEIRQASITPTLDPPVNPSRGSNGDNLRTLHSPSEVVGDGPTVPNISAENGTQEAGLSTVASGVGKPLYTDAITCSCARLDYARVCVMLDYNAKLPKHIVVMLPSNDEGQTTPYKVDVEYEWIPSKCVRCRALGHSQANCPLNKDSKKPPVNVYVPRKVQVVQPHATRIDQSNKNGHGINLGTQNQETIHSDVVGASVDDMMLPSQTTNSPRQGKGKEIAATWNVRGLNRRVQQVAVAELVKEFCLKFCGLVETRVADLNVSRVQAATLPTWDWFTDLTEVGNRIWIAWDPTEIRVEILMVHRQIYPVPELQILRSSNIRCIGGRFYGYIC
ncbi:UNVERIFIED_CONTAM: hypothetical protein Slati_1517000 [Sesamum latifolium]|uniref:DUF4283 domain-containing protein n=1 Tax=Sesamum latifolium TaxID=2727402 RepID=A0AAW2XBN1_9LAMI